MFSSWNMRSQWNPRLHSLFNAFADQDRTAVQCSGSTARLFTIGGVQDSLIKTLTLLIPIQYVVVSMTVRDGSFGCFEKGIANVLIILLNIGGTKRC